MTTELFAADRGSFFDVGKARYASAFEDITRGLFAWRVWTLLAMNDIRSRYRRSAIGQFWLTISMAVSIVALGLLWGMILHSEIRQTLPYIGVGLMVWSLLSGLIVEMSTVFVHADSYLKQIRMPKSVFINQVIVRNLIIFAHNVLLIPIIFLFFPPQHYLGFALVPIGVLLFALNGVWIGLLLGTFCARYRDFSPIMASLLQIMFFVTPVIWNPAQVGPQAWYVVHLNPFAAFHSILKDPLLGNVPEASAYATVVGVTIVGFAIAIPFFARFRSRIVYWL